MNPERLSTIQRLGDSGLVAACFFAFSWVCVAAPGPAEIGAANTAALKGTVNLAAATKPAATPAAKAAADASHYSHGAMGGAGGTPPPPAPPVAVVYAEPRDDATRAAVAKANPPATGTVAQAKIVQKDLRFVPALLPVRVGTTVAFPNQDNIYHNVFSYSESNEFDLGRYRKNENAPSITFDKPGVSRIYCEIHEFMRATVLVLDTPYFTVSDEAGGYSLDGLEPGAYTLTAWINEKSVWRRPVDLKAGDAIEADLAPESPAKPAP